VYYAYPPSPRDQVFQRPMQADPDKSELLTLDGSLFPDQRRGVFDKEFRAVPETRCSSSPQPAASEFATIISEIQKLDPNIRPDQIVIFDLRAERHFHIRDRPVVVEADHIDEVDDLDADEDSDVGEIFNCNALKLVLSEGDLASKSNSSLNLKVLVRDKSNSSLSSLDFAVIQARTEKEVVHDHNMWYERFPVVNNSTPTDAVVYEFIQAVLLLPRGSWVHFHCHGGKGRSAIFMAMFDMLQRARNPEIPQGAYKPRENRKLQLKEDGPTSPTQLRRMQFVDEFDQYINEVWQSTAGKNPKSWSAWKAERRCTPAPFF
jgi:hypothetical protein